ncbi:MAG: hypothetical protein ACI9JM_001220 [Halioglobus sp.]|jgi:hypothetical protein
MSLTKICSILLSVVFMGILGGCKLHVISPPSGDIVSGSGSLDCPGGSVCEFEITDTDSAEEFTAIPRPGYRFVRWQSGEGLGCSTTEGPTCTLQIPEDELAAEFIVNSLLIASIIPVYTDTGIDTDGDGFLDSDDSCPDFGLPGYIDDLGCPLLFATVLAPDGNEWSQPTSFRNLSWNEVDAACPAGACSGALGGFDVTGWSWANIDNANTLFNSYGVSPSMGPGPDVRTEQASIWARNFLGTDDFSPTIGDIPVSSLYAWLSGEPSEAFVSYNQLYNIYDIDDKFETRLSGSSAAESYRGVLLFRAVND